MKLVLHKPASQNYESDRYFLIIIHWFKINIKQLNFKRIYCLTEKYFNLHYTGQVHLRFNSPDIRRVVEKWLFIMKNPPVWWVSTIAGPTRLELATSGVTGRCSLVDKTILNPVIGRWFFQYSFILTIIQYKKPDFLGQALCYCAKFRLLFDKQHLLHLLKSICPNLIKIDTRTYIPGVPIYWVKSGLLFLVDEPFNYLAVHIVYGQYYMWCFWNIILYGCCWIKGIGIVVSEHISNRNFINITTHSGLGSCLITGSQVIPLESWPYWWVVYFR